MSKKFGYTCSVDLYECDATLFNKEQILAFVDELLDVIGMKIHDNHIYMSEYGEADVYGWTMIAMLDMSNMSLHTHKNRIYIDVFSCKAYSINDVIEVAKEFFGGNVARTTFHLR